jgi:TPR repeat protein
MHERALGVAAPDLAQARSYYTRACDGGVLRGCSNLGAVVLRGDAGSPADPVAAAELFRRACEGRTAVACANLAALHETGSGVPRDPQRARELREQACRAGHARSCLP